jgi:hypothetical protein
LQPFADGRCAIKQALGLAAFVLGLAFSFEACPAGFRGAFDPLTPDSRIYNRYEAASWRPLPATDGIERFFSFTTRSAVPGREGSREIWIHRNLARAGLALPTIQEARLPLLRDPTGTVSFTDPCWSPDGKYLAYVRASYNGLAPAIYVQEFEVSEDIAAAATPVGAPIPVVPSGGGEHRYPTWSPDGLSLCYQSTASGRSFDIYTITVFPSVGSAVRRTFDDRAAEQRPVFHPDGTKIACQTNYLGPDVIAIVDLTTSPHAFSLAETRAAPVSHRRPGWSSDGASIYYSAPKNEDAGQISDIWKLDLATQAKCAIYLDATASSDPDVSRYGHHSPDGIPFNYFLFTAMAGSPTFTGPNIWRGQFIYNCVPPLQMGVVLQPRTLQLGSDGQNVTASLSFPASTRAKGYQAASFDGPAEGVRMRNTILVSPTMEGIPARTDPVTGFLPVFTDKVQNGEPYMNVTWNRSDIEAFLIRRGLVGKDVPVKVEAYSNGVGRRFQGFAYIKLNVSDDLTGALAVSSSPNPFNPRTKIEFATSTDAQVTVRIFDVRGALVKELAKGSYPRGSHVAEWDGRDSRGHDAPSGIYFAVAQAAGAAPARHKLVLVR